MSKYSMKEIIEFLRRLQRNNNRQWFGDHKAEFMQLQSEFNVFVDDLIMETAKFDPTIAGLSARDCTYRIYRDVRFSDDKSPYKTHLGAFITRGGKKSGYMGYYIQVGTGGDGFPQCHMIAAGDYCCDPRVLQVVREDIIDGEGDFDNIVRDVADKRFSLDVSNSLKRNPKGFAADAPWGEYLRLKNYCLTYVPDDDFMLAPGLVGRMAEMMRTAKPFLDYVNRAIDYVKEEG